MRTIILISKINPLVDLFIWTRVLAVIYYIRAATTTLRANPRALARARDRGRALALITLGFGSGKE